MNNNLKGALFMVLSAASFALMKIFIALTGDTVPLFQQLFFRNLIASAIAFRVVYRNKIPYFGKKENRKLLIIRSCVGFCGMVSVFYASAHASQGDVAIIGKTSPFIITIIAFFLLKEAITKYQIIGLVLAFLGAFLAADPQFDSSSFPIFVAFLSAIFEGTAYSIVAILNKREHPSVIIFFFSAFSTLCTLPLMLANFVWASALDWLFLLCIGIFAAGGQIALTYAYAIAKASEVSIYNYSSIIFSMLFGFLFLQETVKASSAWGAVLVILSGILVYLGNRKQEKVTLK